MYRILIVEDDEIIARSIQEHLQTQKTYYRIVGEQVNS